MSPHLTISTWVWANLSLYFQGHFVDVSIIQLDAARAFNVLKHPWIPPASYKFPKIDVSGHSRSVCVVKWLSDFQWLSYSAKLTGVLCRYCVLFRRISSHADRGQNVLGQLVTKPLSGNSLKDAIITLRLHEQKHYHKYSTSQAEEFLVRHVSPRYDVDRLLNTADQDQQMENRRILISIVKCILFLASQNIALRGHDDDGIPDNVNMHLGNFKNLIAFRAEAGDSILAKHLKTCPKNASYLSPRVQNELILLSASIVRGKLIRDLIENRLYYSLLADETADTSGTEQLSISVRYVSPVPDDNGELIHEVFLGFVPLDNLKAVGVAEKLCSFVVGIGLSINLIRGTSHNEKQPAKSLILNHLSKLTVPAVAML